MTVYSIADVIMALDYPASEVFEELTPLAYRQFSVSCSEPAGMTILLRAGSTTIGLPAGQPLFRNGDCWSLFPQKDGYALVVEPSNVAGALSVTRFNPEEGEALVVYNQSVAERQRAARLPVRNPFEYPVDRMLFMYLLANRGGFLGHAVAAEIGGCGIAFAGLSGAGKSTLSRLLRERGWPVFSDERIAIRQIDDEFKLFGTPWLGEAGIAFPGSHRLDRLVFLEKAPCDRIDPIPPAEALSRLLSLISVPWYNREVVPGLLALAEQLVTSVPSYALSFRPTPAVIDLLESFCQAG